MKKYLKRFFAGCLFAAVLFFLLPGENSRASGLEQTGASEHSVTVRWNLKEDALRYLIYVGTSNADSTLYASADDSVMTWEIDSLLSGSRNYVRVDYEYMDTSGDIRTKLAGYTAAARTLPGKVQNVRQTGWYDRTESCSIAWEKMACADGYEYMLTDRKGQTVARGRVRGGTETARLNRIPSSEVCTVLVRAYIELGEEEIFGEWSDPSWVFAQPRIQNVRVSKGKLKIQWKRIAGVSGYDIYVSRSGRSGYKKVKSVGGASSSIVLKRFGGKKISGKNVYYVYVIAKKKAGKRTVSGERYFYRNTKNKNKGYFL